MSPQSSAAFMEAIPKRPFWAAPLLRRKFAAKRRIAQGRLCRPRAFKCRRVEPPCRRRNPKKKHLLSRCFFFGTPEGTRTPNIQNRNLTLYPIELRTHISFALRYYNRIFLLCKGEKSFLLKFFRPSPGFKASGEKKSTGLLQNRILKNQAKEKVSENRQGDGSR